MTLAEWLDAFTAGAATLPGWSLQEGRLRRRTTDLAGWHCPLMAQYTCQHPQARLMSSHPTVLKSLWTDTLAPMDAEDVMDAADNEGVATHRLGPLRAALLAACGVPEEAP